MKRYMITKFATEYHRAKLFLEVPDDTSEEDLDEYLADYEYWDWQDDNFEEDDEYEIEETTVEPDSRLIRDADGSLIEVEEDT
jgi:hypothetical protein